MHFYMSFSTGNWDINAAKIDNGHGILKSLGCYDEYPIIMKLIVTALLYVQNPVKPMLYCTAKKEDSNQTLDICF